jgi:hypothetical protein
MKANRQIIKASDIQIYFGKSQSTSNKMLREIRKTLNKVRYQPITIKEFCGYYNVSVDEVIETILLNDATTVKERSG